MKTIHCNLKRKNVGSWDSHREQWGTHRQYLETQLVISETSVQSEFQILFCFLSLKEWWIQVEKRVVTLKCGWLWDCICPGGLMWNSIRIGCTTVTLNCLSRFPRCCSNLTGMQVGHFPCSGDRRQSLLPVGNHMKFKGVHFHHKTMLYSSHWFHAL